MHLWGSEGAYVKDIVDRLSKSGYTVRVAIANTIGCTWAMARYSKEKIVLKEKQAEVLAPLPIAALRIDEETIALLQKLGLRQIKDMIGLCVQLAQMPFLMSLPVLF